MKKKQNNQKSRFRQITKILLKNKLHKKITPERVRNTLDELGPTFVKIGQILSTREDIIPTEYCQELTKLKENVSPLSFITIKEVIEDELKKPIDEIFSYIDETPIGSASIGQVHLASLIDGTKVVVKVMRPHIFEMVTNDFILLHKVVKYLDLFTDFNDVVDLNTIFNETYESMKLEMNFLNEQANNNMFAEMFKDIKYIKIPKTFNEYTTEHVFVMEYIDGVRINDIERLKELGYDLKDICSKLGENYISQIIDYGVFHADPHSGNILISDNKITWLDFGMIGQISKRDQQLYKKAIISVVKNDVSGLKNVILTIGVCKGTINHAQLYKDIEILLFKYSNLSINDFNMGYFLQEVMQIAKANGISLPKGVTLLGRSILIIQKVIGMLDEETNVLELFENHIKDNYKKEFSATDKVKDVVKKIYNSSSKMTEIPSQLYDLLNLTIKGERHSNVEITNLNQNITKTKKMVNRLILGIITSSLILAFSLIFAIAIFRTKYEWIVITSLVLAGFGFIIALGLIVIIIVMMLKDKK